MGNKAGAGGRLATDFVAKAEPDGYTLLLLVGGDTVVTASNPKLPYNLLRDFQFASTLRSIRSCCWPALDLRTPTLKAMLEVARKEPGAVRAMPRGATDRRSTSLASWVTPPRPGWARSTCPTAARRPP